MQCKAKSKRSGERCKRAAMIGRDVCAMHGGKSPRGMDSPHTKTGRYSKDAPARLNARYLAGLEDPELCSLRDEIAMLDARTGELFRMASISGEHQSLVDAREVIDSIFTINEDSPTAQQKLQDGLRSLYQILHRSDDTETWKQINSNFELRAKLAAGETNRMKITDQFVTQAQLQILQVRLIQAAEHISNREDKRKFFASLREIFESGADHE